MSFWELRRFAGSQCAGRSEPPLVVIGITHAQTCSILRGRLRALRESGFRVALICSPGELLDQLAAEDEVEAVRIPMERDLAPMRDLVSLWRITCALLRLRPQITEFSTPKAGLLGNLAAFLCAVPRRVYLVRGLRLETTAGWQRRLLAWSERAASACSHVVVCNSQSLRRRMIDLGLAGADKLRVLGNGSSVGVDLDRFVPAPSRLRTELAIAPDVPVIGFVGRLTRDKGVPELLDAFEAILKQSPQAVLLLVGWYDRSADALSRQARERIAAHARIVRTGFVKDTAPWYRVMDLMVLPTWREGLPNVVLEAAASGVPVVTTKVTGACDAVLPGTTGLLVAPGDPEAIADAVLRLIEDGKLRSAMGGAARRWVQERFARERVLARTIAEYWSLVRAPGRAKRAALATDGFAAD